MAHSFVNGRARSARRVLALLAGGALLGALAGDALAAGPTSRDLEQAEQSLAEEARLEPILRLALARNPALSEANARSHAAREVSSAASRLPDPELEYELWGQPLAHPVSFGSAQMHAIGVRQMFPAPGTLGAREAALSAETSVFKETRRAREQELVARVRRAFAEYYLADREYRLHLSHVGLAQQALDMTRAIYQGGGGSQQEVLRAAVEMSRLHNDVAAIDAARRTSQVLLNTLMARPASAPLGPPAALERSLVQVRAEELERSLGDRPDVVAALNMTRAREREVDAARASGRWPSFSVGASYMYMPPTADRHHYGVTLSMSLPWLNPRYGEEQKAAEARLSADRSALSNVRYTARYELYEATERLRAARESLAIIERDLLPQVEQGYESARAGYRGGQGESIMLFDALRSLLDVRIERERMLANVATALADVERAAGRPLSPSTTGGRR